MKWLSERGVPSSDTVLVGNSLGSGPATELAASLPVAGLVLISGYTSLPDFGAAAYPFVPVRPLMLDRFDNLAKIGRVAAPILLLHGTADRIIPDEHATALAAATDHRAQVVPFEGSGHELVGSPALSPVIHRWLASLRR
jgi:pimeloyl-ACP methyl ester carboxylesterase